MLQGIPPRNLQKWQSRLSGRTVPKHSGGFQKRMVPTRTISLRMSADLGGRDGWLPKAERVKTLSGGVRGGVGRRVPTSEAAVFSRHPRLRHRPKPGGPGPKRPGDLAHRCLGPGSRLSPVDFLQAEFLTSCGANPWVRVSKP